jgi:hypothetical protein
MGVPCPFLSFYSFLMCVKMCSVFLGKHKWDFSMRSITDALSYLLLWVLQVLLSCQLGLIPEVRGHSLLSWEALSDSAQPSGLAEHKGKV